MTVADACTRHVHSHWTAKFNCQFTFPFISPELHLDSKDHGGVFYIVEILQWVGSSTKVNHQDRLTLIGSLVISPWRSLLCSLCSKDNHKTSSDLPGLWNTYFWYQVHRLMMKLPCHSTCWTKCTNLTKHLTFFLRAMCRIGSQRGFSGRSDSTTLQTFLLLLQELVQGNFRILFLTTLLGFSKSISNSHSPIPVSVWSEERFSPSISKLS